MNENEQGVLINNKSLNLLFIQVLLLFIIASSVIAETSPDNNPTPVVDTQKHRVIVVHTPKNTLHASIVDSLEAEPGSKHPDLIYYVSTSTEEKIKTIDNKNDLVIVLGLENINKANKHYPYSKKLFLATDPVKFRFDTGKNNNDAVLYMTQPYCRQMKFIHATDKNWNTVSILSHTKNNVHTEELNKCATKLGLELYVAKLGVKDSLSRNIKDALNHSDILLALPDKSIYNSKSVKNILLTSYRYRKPVIAFSENFVKAGALASIHSSPEQIAKSTNKLVENYFINGKIFLKSVNYPQLFNVSINRQVFKALGLSTLDINKLKHDIIGKDPEEPGH